MSRAEVGGPESGARIPRREERDVDGGRRVVLREKAEEIVRARVVGAFIL